MISHELDKEHHLNHYLIDMRGARGQEHHLTTTTSARTGSCESAGASSTAMICATGLVGRAPPCTARLIHGVLRYIDMSIWRTGPKVHGVGGHALRLHRLFGQDGRQMTVAPSSSNVRLPSRHLCVCVCMWWTLSRESTALEWLVGVKDICCIQETGTEHGLRSTAPCKRGAANAKNVPRPHNKQKNQYLVLFI